MKGNQTSRIDDSSKAKKFYLQPLAVALTCLVFFLLVLVTSLLDLQTLDRTLDRFMHDGGLNIISSVEKTAETYFQRLVYTQQSVLDPQTDSFFSEESFDLQDTLVSGFVNLAQELDGQAAAGQAPPDRIQSIAFKENLHLIALVNEQGKPVLYNRPVPKNILNLSIPVARGLENIKMDLFHPSDANPGLRCIILQRKAEPGAIILALDEAGFRYRCLRVSLQKAIEEIIPNSGIQYFRATDGRNRVLALLGKSPALPPELTSKKLLDGKSRQFNFDGQSFFEMAAARRVAGEYPTEMRLILARGPAEKILEKNKKRIFFSMGLMILVVSLSMWLLYRNQNKHLSKIQKMEEQVRQAEKLTALGRLAAGVAHEIRNPLNAISMAAQRLASDNPGETTRLIRDEIKRLDHIIEDFLNLSKTRELQFGYHDLTACLEEMVFLMEEEAAAKGIDIKTRWPDIPLMAHFDFDRLKQVFLNIIKNAVESVPDGGRIDIRVEQQGEEWVRITISDTGIGLSVEEIEHVFDPDYTTKSGGLGLGLTIAHEIVQSHDGHIRVSSRPGAGTIFEIRLPLNGPRAD